MKGLPGNEKQFANPVLLRTLELYGNEATHPYPARLNFSYNLRLIFSGFSFLVGMFSQSIEIYEFDVFWSFVKANSVRIDIAFVLHSLLYLALEKGQSDRPINTS